MKRLLQTQTKEQHFLLSAPATLALAIDAQDLTWPDNRALNVLILNPRKYELVDRGQWFRFVPSMLESRGAISVTATTVDTAELKASRAPDALMPSDRITVNLSSECAAEVLRTSGDRFDLAISFSDLPYRRLETPNQTNPFFDDLVELAERGIPYYFTSFSSVHALFNHAFLRAHAANAEPVVAINPFSLVSKRVGENLNRVISRVRPEHLPLPDDSIDGDYLDALKITARMVLNSHRLGEASQDLPVGAPVKDDLIHTLDGVCISLRTREVIDCREQARLGILDPQWDEAISDYDPDWDETDRLIWAAHVRYFALADGLLASIDQPAA